jgi:dipeptide transport system ATP-binding protein
MRSRASAFSVERGKTLAIVGESGSGKSTLARIVALIDPATGGELLIEGKPVDIAKQKLTREMRSKVQMVFQNPYGSLNPRQKIGDVLMEPLLLNTDTPAANAATARATCWSRSGCRPSISTAIRICSRAGSASASPLRAP